MTAPRQLHVLCVIDSLGQGGAERSLLNMVPVWKRMGLTIDVAYLSDVHGLQEKFISAGASLFPVVRAGRRASIGGLREVIRVRRPDLVHTSLFEADVAGRIAARLEKVPVVTSLVNESYGKEALDGGVRWSRLRAAQLVDIGTCRLATRFHAVSSTVADTMSRRLMIPRSRIDVIHRGRDPELLGRRNSERTAKAKADLGLANNARVILAAGRHEHQKGLDVLVNAMPRVLAESPEAVLIVAGREGNQTSRLRAEIERLDLAEKVRLLGHRDDLPDLLCAADVFTLPSRWEGFPGVVIEAMALEVPIVATDIKTVHETVDGTAAALVPVDDANALAGAIRAVLDEPGRFDTGPARRRFERELTVEGVAARMADFYRSAVSTRGDDER